MNDQAPNEPFRSHPPSVRKLGTVPVYNCHVYLSSPDNAGMIAARGATLPEVRATGKTEREALQNMVRAFKETITRYTSEGGAIPWIDLPEPPAAGEKQRWVPVHF